jgi:hypothetical protein
MGAKNCFLFFLLICSTLAFPSDNDWTEVKSPHFTVLGDGPGRKWNREIEKPPVSPAARKS